MKHLALILMLAMAAGCNGTRGESRSVHVRVDPAPMPVDTGQQHGPQTLAKATTLRLDGIGEIHLAPGQGATISTSDGRGPTPPKDAATSHAGPDGAGSSSGGAADLPINLGGATMWAGIALIIAGLVIWLAKRKGLAVLGAAGPSSALAIMAGRLPPGTGLGVALLGLIVLFLPMLADVLGPVIAFAGYGAVGIGLVYLLWWAVRASRTMGEEQARKDAGDHLPAVDPRDIKTRELRR